MYPGAPFGRPLRCGPMVGAGGFGGSVPTEPEDMVGGLGVMIYLGYYLGSILIPVVVDDDG